MLNAAIWLGAAVFYIFAAGPLAHSAPMTQLLGSNSGYFASAIEQMLAARLIKLELVCGLIALFHLGAEWLYLGKVPRKAWLGLLLFLLAANLFNGSIIQPRLKRWNVASHAVNLTPQQREIGAKSLQSWHAARSALNLVTLGCLALYSWRISTPPFAGRFVAAAKFRG